MCAAKKKSKRDNNTKKELPPKKTSKGYLKNDDVDKEVDDKLIGDDRDMQQAQQPTSISAREDRKTEMENNNY